MEIELAAITTDNYYEVGLLTTNKNGIATCEEEYICGNAMSIAESKFYPELIPQAIYIDQELIGFILSGPYAKDNTNYWILRFMIDYKYQGKGLGKAAFLAFIKQVKANNRVQEIYLGLDKSNNQAIRLYESCGFKFTGKIKEGELVYVLNTTISSKKE